jgi:hypothetical protein
MTVRQNDDEVYMSFGMPGRSSTVKIEMDYSGKINILVWNIVTAVPGTTERERWIEERGTSFWMQFYIVGTKTFLRSRPRNGVPGTRNARSFPFPGDYGTAACWSGMSCRQNLTMNAVHTDTVVHLVTVTTQKLFPHASVSMVSSQ